MEVNGVLSPSANSLEEPRMVKKLLFSPFSPMAVDSENRSQHESELMTPKCRLSLNLDESTQSPLCLDNDAGYGESIRSCSSEECSGVLLSQLDNTRSPLAELNCNGSSVSNRKVLQAKRHNKRPTSLIYESSLKSDPSPTSSENSTFKIPHALTSHNTRPSSLPSVHESWPGRTGIQGSGRSWIRQISSPLARMTLVSPTGSSVFSFESQPSTSSTHSLTHRSSIAESDGYFSELEVFENDDISDSTSDTIKSLINAPMSTGSPITFSANPENSFPCPTPVRPLPPQRCNSSSQLVSAGMKQSALKRSSLKRSSPSSELAQFHQPKRPPLPFLHCSNSQDSPITTATEPSPQGRPQLKGRCLLRSQSYIMPPPPAVGDGRMSPSSPGELIGDESVPYALPLVKGSAPDLKCISPETLNKLLAGEFKDVVDTYTIIDCRYPYEYDGGHIPGAVNIWEKGELLDKFLTNPEHPKPSQRTVYIFHCEFSSKRGPQMCRFLREVDRKKNGLDFPKLYYPELYLLEGGYKAFYHAFSDMCEPKSYCLMLDEKYKDELRHFKHRAKSWTGDSIMASRRQVPSRCWRRTTVNFGTRPKSNSLDSRVSSPSAGQENVH